MSFTAKSVIVDIADNWGDANYLSVCQIDFWSSGSKITVDPGTTCSVYATTNIGATTGEVWDTSGDKFGSSVDVWYSADGSNTNQRLICVFVSSTTFDEIRVNNSHYEGGDTTRGAKNVVINISTDEITSTTYNAVITNATKIFDGQFDEHVALDQEDEQILTLGGDITFSADAGSYTLTGSWVDFNLFPALSGSYTLTGSDVDLDITINVAAGAYTLTGSDVDLFKLFVTEPGAYTITGLDVDLRAPFIFASTGTYTVTGSIASLGRSISAGSGSFALTGAEVTLSGIREADIVATLPVLSFSLNSGGFFNVAMPTISIESTGTAGQAGQIEAELPGLSLISYAGGYVEDSFPVFSLSMEATLTTVAEISIQFPILEFSIIASRASEGDIDITLPMLQASMEATAGIVGSISGKLPRFSMGIVALPGMTADLEGTFRMMKFSAVGGPSGPGTISADLPMLEMDLTSGAIESDVLRYNWERVT